MYVNQIAVFLENRQGRISELCKVLAANGIDIVTMSIADTYEFGILRAITRDNKKALEVLKKAGFTAKCTDLIGISVDDEPGGLSKVLSWLYDEGISVEYLYSYVRTEAKKATILLKTSDYPKTIEILTRHDSKFLENNIL